MASMPKPVIKMNTPAVNRLHIIARLADELSRDLDRVDFLKDDIVDKRKFTRSVELAQKAKASVNKVRDSIAAKGGTSVAKGYK